MVNLGERTLVIAVLGLGEAGSVIAPAGGAVIFALLAVVSEYVIKASDGGARNGPLIILPFALIALATAQWGAIAAARRNTTFRSDQ